MYIDIEEEQIIYWLKQLLMAVECLHRHNIVHKFITPEYEFFIRYYKCCIYDLIPICFGRFKMYVIQKGQTKAFYAGLKWNFATSWRICPPGTNLVQVSGAFGHWQNWSQIRHMVRVFLFYLTFLIIEESFSLNLKSPKQTESLSHIYLAFGKI